MNDHRVWTVYRYYDAAGRLLYIGVTGQGHWRTHEHRRAAPWWPSVVRAEFEHFTDGVVAFEHETALIARLAPLHNRADNPSPPTPPLRVGRPRRPDPNRPRLAGPGGPKRRQVEAYLVTLDGEQLGRTAREITAALTDQGMDVSERYVARILDQWTASRWAAGRRGSGSPRRRGGR
jgi:hypothetical protein